MRRRMDFPSWKGNIFLLIDSQMFAACLVTVLLFTASLSLSTNNAPALPVVLSLPSGLLLFLLDIHHAIEKNNNVNHSYHCKLVLTLSLTKKFKLIFYIF